MPADLTGKVIVIAGARGGIAEATAHRFEQEGAHVVGIDLREHSLGELSLQADLTDEEQVRQAYARVRERYARVDVLFNNAGLNDPSDQSALDTELATWQRVQSANLTTVFLCCKHGIPHLLDTEPDGGSVVNTASFLSVMGAATSQMAYAAAKAGVLALTRDLGINLARRGVRVNALLLGPVQTPALDDLFASEPDKVERRVAHLPMGRFGTAEEVAGTVAYLASADSGFVTATGIAVDGGITAAYTIPTDPSPLLRPGP